MRRKIFKKEWIKHLRGYCLDERDGLVLTYLDEDEHSNEDDWVEKSEKVRGYI